MLVCCLGSFSLGYSFIGLISVIAEGKAKASPCRAVGKVVVRIMALVLERVSLAGEDVHGADNLL